MSSTRLPNAHRPTPILAATILPHELAMSTSALLDRRTFVRRVLSASAGMLAGQATRLAVGPNMLIPNQFGSPDARRAPDVLRLALVTLSDGSPRLADAVAACRHGAELGVDEAIRAAALLRKELVVVPVIHDRERARELIASGDIAAAIVAGTAADIAELGVKSSRAGTVLMNCLAAGDALRNEQCARTVFHIAPSETMIATAKRLAVPSSSDGPNVESQIELWHGSLERFVAGQLNDRYRARVERPMDSAAWAGWFAVKAIWEASQRARSVEGRAIADFMERDTAAFDGHKGVALSFRSWDHQLRQPLYAVPTSADGTADIATVPSAPGPSRAALDAIGTPAQETRCQWR